VRILPALDVLHREMIAGLLRDLVHDRDHDERPDRERRGQLIDGWVVRRPVRGRIELGAELVGGEQVAGGLESVLGPGVRPFGLGILARPEGRVAEAGPDGNGGRDGVGQVHVLRALEGVVVDAPEGGLIVGGGRRRRRGMPPRG
jgi:hypothetical protein